MLEEDGEAEVGGLEGRVLLVIQKQKVLGLEIPVENPHRVAAVHDGDHFAAEQRRGSFGVVSPRDDAVE